MIETMTVIVRVSDCLFFMTYWSNYIIRTGIVKIFKYPAIQHITFIDTIYITIRSLCDQQTSTFMVIDSFVVFV